MVKNMKLGRKRESVVGDDIVPIFKGGGELLREDLYFLFLLFLIIRFTLWEASIQSVHDHVVVKFKSTGNCLACSLLLILAAYLYCPCVYSYLLTL